MKTATTVPLAELLASTPETPWIDDGAIELTMCDDHTETAIEITTSDGAQTVAYATSDASARLICHAVGVLPALVAALAACVEAIEDYRSDLDYPGQGQSDTLARAALAQAREVPTP